MRAKSKVYIVITQNTVLLAILLKVILTIINSKYTNLFKIVLDLQYQNNMSLFTRG